MSAKSRFLAAVDYLAHIEEAASLAVGYIRGMSKDDFLKDKRTQQAIIYNILIIGEAATKIINEYPEFVANNTDMPWREMRGIRNRMAHGYYELDLDIIWDTVTGYLDKLSQQIRSINNR